jgi:hypothetical protein
VNQPHLQFAMPVASSSEHNNTFDTYGARTSAPQFSKVCTTLTTISEELGIANAGAGEKVHQALAGSAAIAKHVAKSNQQEIRFCVCYLAPSLLFANSVDIFRTRFFTKQSNSKHAGYLRIRALPSGELAAPRGPQPCCRFLCQE